MPESTKHGRTLNYGLAAAGVLLDHLPDALVAYDLLFLFEEGNPRAAVAPDLMVALGAGRHDRNSYKLWEEGRPPDFALEALSQRTWQKDVQIKPGLYRDLGVREFWQLDPLRKLPEPMIGYRLHAGVYKPIPVEQSGGRRSEVLGAELFFDGTELRIRSLRTGKNVPAAAVLLAIRAPTCRGAGSSTNPSANVQRSGQPGRLPSANARRSGQPGRLPSANARRSGQLGKRPSANATKPSNGSPNWRPSCGANTAKARRLAPAPTVPGRTQNSAHQTRDLWNAGGFANTQAAAMTSRTAP